MPSQLESWEDVLRERVVHGPTRDTESAGPHTLVWNTFLHENEAPFEFMHSRPSHHRTSWSKFFSGRPSIESLESVYEAMSEELLVYGPVVCIVDSPAIDLSDPPDPIPPPGVNLVEDKPTEPLAESPPSLTSELDVLFSVLGIYGCQGAASKVQEFLAIRDEDQDEPPINRESFLSLVQFLIQEPQLLPPIVSSDMSGLMEIEWHLMDNGDPDTLWGRGNGVVSLKFLESGSIQYVALSGPKRSGQDRLRLHGESTKCEMLAVLGEFVEKITSS